MSTTPIIDGQGRLIPQRGDRVYSETDRGYFCLTQPELNLEARLSRTLTMFGEEVTGSLPEVEEIVDLLNSTRDAVFEDEQLRGLFDGVHVPFVLPQSSEDFAQDFDQILLPAVERSFRDAYPNREFRKFSTSGLTDNCSIVPSSRWSQIPAAPSSSSICGWYFPTALAGYAIPDQRSLISRLPEALVLSGPSEVAAALTCAPELLYKTDGKYGKLLALSSVEPTASHDPYFFWFFESYGWDLDFNMRSYLGAVSEYYSGGLTVLASG